MAPFTFDLTNVERSHGRQASEQSRRSRGAEWNGVKIAISNQPRVIVMLSRVKISSVSLFLVSSS